MTDVSDNPESTAKPPIKRRWRFSLGTLILATALGLAILANYLQYRDVQATKQFLWRRHREMSEELNGLLLSHERFDRVEDEDPTRIHVSLVPTGSDREWFWQIALPEHEKYRIQFAVEGIAGDGFSTLPFMSKDVIGPTWLKVRLDAEGCKGIPPPNTASTLIACQSFRRPYVHSPSTRWATEPQGWCCALPGELHLWSIAGRDQRESFAPDAPPTLIRMRTVMREGVDASQPDTPGPGFLIWLEKLPAK
jgi:hypothetical protein